MFAHDQLCGHAALGSGLPHIWPAGSTGIMNFGAESACMYEKERVCHTRSPRYSWEQLELFTLSLLCFLFICSSCVHAGFSKAPIMSFLLLESWHAGVLPDSGSTARLVNNWKLLTYNNLALLTINDLVKAHTYTHAHTISCEEAEFWIPFVQH